jgi:hypothetical protein
MYKFSILLICLFVSSCSDNNIYKGKTEQQIYQMYHEARLKIVMRWTCNVLIEEAYNYKQAKSNIIDPFEKYFNEYPYHFFFARDTYRTVIEMTLRDHPYKLPITELDISYIKPFSFEQLTCKDKLDEWKILKYEWELNK